MGNHYDRIQKENFDAYIKSFLTDLFKAPDGTIEALDSPIAKTFDRVPDFLRKVVPENAPAYILHLEVQSQNHPDMIFRMNQYASLILEKYRLPVRQLVLYLGDAPPKMATSLREVIPDASQDHQYELIDIRQFDAEWFLESDIPEVVLFAILANPGKYPPNMMLSQTLKRLEEICQDQTSLEKFIGHLLTLSELRNIVIENEDQEERKRIMPLDLIGIKKSEIPIFNKGVDYGIEHGYIEGLEKMAYKLLEDGTLGTVQISSITGIPLWRVLEIQKNGIEERTMSGTVLHFRYKGESEPFFSYRFS